MAEDQKIEVPPFVSFSDRMAQAHEDGEKDAERKAAASHQKKFRMAENEMEFARAIVNLSQNSDFKKYMEFESFEIAERMANGFKAPAESEFGSRVFAEQMSFNAGRSYQMNHLRNLRTQLAQTYLAILKTQTNGEKNGAN